MSFFELFDQFFQLNAQQTIAPLATKLYMYWLHEFNQARWPAVLYRRANQVYIDLEVDKKSLERATAQLVARGLLRHTAGTKIASGTWHLNYGPAADWQLVEGNFSPQHVGNNSPQDSEIGPFSGGEIPLEMPDRPLLKGNFSPPIRNRQDQTREDQTKKKVGEAAEEITLAPLTAKKPELVPPVAEPPHAAESRPVAAAELPEALAAEARALAAEIAPIWDLSEIRNQPKWARIHAFTRCMARLGRLPDVRLQLAGYLAGHLRPGVRPHQLDRWLGSPADDYAQGEWCGCDWPSVAAKAQARPAGHGQPPPPPTHAKLNIKTAATAQQQPVI
ncbi:hypothetical protein [Hymenobacter cheonanensis]|uniref:hypothetical protein n=1 Tax=Hymenobacter sp. CA2-7 TaxID=3063993 RepID=UPI002713D69F|nr:hypothetical protein [Hymenobacter sp. CA2-7]MDO7887966.1 hypothetical protein [Hymenobacter sp. CA2-7]